MVSQRNWPKENHFASTTIPYDADKKVPVEKAGPVQLSCCVIEPHPEDPKKCIIKSLGKSSESEKIPKFALKMIIRSLIVKFRTMTGDFKQSKTYANLLKEGQNTGDN